MVTRRKPARKRAASDGDSARPAAREDLAAQIVDAALELAEEIGWDAIGLHMIAERLGITLGDIQAHYRDLDAIADAWFGRARAAMLAPQPDDPGPNDSEPGGVAALPARERLYQAILRWFDALASHRRVTGQILRAKLYPSHPHHWVPLIFNLSREVHWLRAAARLSATGRQRQMEEIGLSALFLATLGHWLRDDSEGQARTRAALRRRLALADRIMGIWR